MPPKGRYAKLVAVANPEKRLDINKPRGLLPIHPARCLLSGPANSGKRSVLLNILLKIEDRFDKWTVITLDPDTTEWVCLSDKPGFALYSWDDEEFENGIPPDDLLYTPDARSVLILDEIPWIRFNKKQISRIERIFSQVSSHHSMSIFMMHQKATAVPLSIRENMNYITLFKTPMVVTAEYYSRMTGLPIDKILAGLEGKHDSITIDFTGNGPLLRLNWFTPISRLP